MSVTHFSPEKLLVKYRERTLQAPHYASVVLCIAARGLPNADV